MTHCVPCEQKCSQVDYFFFFFLLISEGILQKSFFRQLTKSTHQHVGEGQYRITELEEVRLTVWHRTKKALNQRNSVVGRFSSFESTHRHVYLMKVSDPWLTMIWMHWYLYRFSCSLNHIYLSGIIYALLLFLLFFCSSNRAKWAQMGRSLYHMNPRQSMDMALKGLHHLHQVSKSANWPPIQWNSFTLFYLILSSKVMIWCFCTCVFAEPSSWKCILLLVPCLLESNF